MHSDVLHQQSQRQKGWDDHRLGTENLNVGSCGLTPTQGPRDIKPLARGPH